ncbi:hypothetical protein F5Y18DRAFT_360267 [Xylariaceae sp. FL1019]|nr:hypothetical protein F5Y18DRAFT_360267 [Xylariaceae sp. FL1019]
MSACGNSSYERRASIVLLMKPAIQSQIFDRTRLDTQFSHSLSQLTSQYTTLPTTLNNQTGLCLIMEDNSWKSLILVNVLSFMLTLSIFIISLPYLVEGSRSTYDAQGAQKTLLTVAEGIQETIMPQSSMASTQPMRLLASRSLLQMASNYSNNLGPSMRIHRQPLLQ